MSTIHTSGNPRPTRSLMLAIAALVLQGGCGAADRPGPSVDRSMSALPPAGDGRRAASAIDLDRFALNGLLLLLLDDATPPRWTDPASIDGCGPGTRITVDGRPLVPGEPMPATAFTLEWRMQGCMPFGTDAVAMTGEVRLTVFHEDDGLSAIVEPRGMVVDGWALGRVLRASSGVVSLL